MHRKADLVAVELFHLGHEMADAVRQPKFNALGPRPEGACEHIRVIAQAVPPTGFDVIDANAWTSMTRHCFRSMWLIPNCQ